MNGETAAARGVAPSGPDAERPAPLKAVGLAVGYLGREVLAGLDLELRAGELACMLGPNGAGKSTLLRTLAGLQAPLRGRIELEGRDAAFLSASARARRSAIVLTDRLDAGPLTVWDLAALGRYPHTGWSGRLSEGDREAVRRGLEEAGAWELRARSCEELSDGERQRASLARALAQDPAVLLLDEPTAFLDLPRRVEAMRALRGLARRGRAVLLSTHDLDLALRAADRLWLVSAGRLRAGLPEELALAGEINSAFDQGDVAFDRANGSFRVHGHPDRRASLSGDPGLRYWTARALEREGVAAEEAVGGAAEGIGIEVRAERGAEGPRWAWRIGGGAFATGSLGELLEALRKDAGAAGAPSRPFRGA